MPATSRMLVPIDFSATSDLAFAYALDMAARERSAMHLLHVVDETGFAAAYPDGFYVSLPEARDGLIAEANERLRALASQCETRGVTVTTEVCTGRPARVIAEVAGDRGTDLIVMGTHGRSGFAHLVLGSVAERVVRTAPCAVLTVRDTARIADVMARAEHGPTAQTA